MGRGNMAGLSIIDDEVCREASKQEIIRRYFKTACLVRQGLASEAGITENREPDAPAEVGAENRRSYSQH